MQLKNNSWATELGFKSMVIVLPKEIATHSPNIDLLIMVSLSLQFSQRAVYSTEINNSPQSYCLIEAYLNWTAMNRFQLIQNTIVFIQLMHLQIAAFLLPKSVNTEIWGIYCYWYLYGLLKFHELLATIIGIWSTLHAKWGAVFRWKIQQCPVMVEATQKCMPGEGMFWRCDAHLVVLNLADHLLKLLKC